MGQFLKSGRNSLQIPFPDNRHVMPDVTGNNVSQSANGKWIVAGDAATLPCISR